MLKASVRGGGREGKDVLLGNQENRPNGCSLDHLNVQLDSSLAYKFASPKILGSLTEFVSEYTRLECYFERCG